MSEEKKTIELTEEDLEKVTGGNINIPNNPKGLKPGDSVYFINIECGNFCMWGIFVEYDEVDNEYRIEWGDQCLMSDGLDYGFIPAGHDYVKPENIL